MRIQLLTQYYPPEVGAAPVRLQAMVRQLVALGHDVDVVTALPNYPVGRIFDGYRRKLWAVEERDGATVRRVWIHASTGSGLGRALGFLSFAGMGVLGMLRSPKPDLVLVGSPPLPVVVPALLTGVLRRRPSILLLADLWPDTAVELGLLADGSRLFRAMAWLERVTYRRMWKISPVTHGQVATLIDDKGVAPGSIAFLPNGVDTSLFTPAAPSNVCDQPPVILFAGALGYAQGLDVIIDAAGIVQVQHPTAVFRFVGNGSERERIERRVVDEGLGGIEFVDPVSVEEVAPMMRSAFAGITSLKKSKLLEGARPSKVFTVMASGRPVVYSGTGEGALLVSDNGAGVVAPPEDHHALAAAIVRLLDDPNEADQMGARGRAFVEENLSWQQLIRSWFEDLGEVPDRW
jgi:colanic acid biosynthesis glycosyl transferase WcaI